MCESGVAVQINITSLAMIITDYTHPDLDRGPTIGGISANMHFLAVFLRGPNSRAISGAD